MDRQKRIFNQVDGGVIKDSEMNEKPFLERLLRMDGLLA